MARPRKSIYPIGFYEWLRIALHEKRPENRMKIFREWRRGQLQGKLGRAPTDDEIFEEIKKWQETEFYDSTMIYVWMDSLRCFAPYFHRTNRSEKARKNAQKRWSKKSS